MMKINKKTLIGVFVVSCVVLISSPIRLNQSVAKEQENIVPKEKQSLQLSIDKVEEAPRGELVIGATFKNVGDEDIILSHPSRCIPDSVEEGESYNISELIGKSELTCQIIWPNGKQITLISQTIGAYFHYSNGNASDHLIISPGESKKIVLSKFGYEYDLPYWNYYPDKPITEPLFPLKGLYQITVSYKNTFSRAIVGGKTQPVWKGTITSNTITVDIK